MEKHRETITAEEFLAALTGNCEKVELVDCKIKGEVDISKAGIERDEDCKYPIDKRVICKNCVFTDDVYFGAAKFQEIAIFGGFGPLNNPKRTVFNGNANFFARGGVTSMHTLFDDQQQSYMLIDIGWEGKKYTHDVIIHIDIIGSKIWIQRDNTEEGVATDLLEAGVPKEDIVLGFHHPKVRPYTEFAVG